MLNIRFVPLFCHLIQIIFTPLESYAYKMNEKSFLKQKDCIDITEQCNLQNIYTLFILY